MNLSNIFAKPSMSQPSVCLKYTLLLALSLLFSACNHNSIRGSNNDTRTAYQTNAFYSADVAQNIRWQNKFKQHLSDQPKHIALLLPLHGPLAEIGLAIQNGFLAAYRQEKALFRTHLNQRPKLSIFDTSDKNMVDLYRQIVKQGINYVVGPLSKEHVNQLVQNDVIHIPTLALNTLQTQDNPLLPTELIQFGLCRTDEVIQVVRQADKKHYHNAVIMAPDNNWGRDIAQTFQTAWEKTGGQIIDTLSFHQQDPQPLSKNIAKLLKIDESQARIAQINHILHEKTRSVLRRRQDIDVIFLAASPTTARQIQPLLKFYYAGHIPIYAISTLYTGTPDLRRDRDLDAIRFCDMPWVLDIHNLPTELQHIHSYTVASWPHSFHAHPKFYAIGVDAYHIITHLSDWAHNTSHKPIQGATGDLYLIKNRICRKLPWAKMQKGRPVILSKIQERLHTPRTIQLTACP